MTIGIDIRVLAGGRKSGVQEYAEQLLAHMLPLDPSVKYKLFFSSFSGELPQYPWLKLPNVAVYRYRFPNRALFYGARLFGLPKLDRLVGGADVFFSPHFFLAPLSGTCRRVTVFHDLSFERFPEFFTFRKRFWHRFEMRPAWQARFSDAIVAVSESTKQDLVRLYGLDPARISRIYSGIAPGLSRPEPAALERFRKEKKLPGRFILFLGTLEPRKNVIALLKAFDLLKRQGSFDDLSLVIAGPRGWLYRELVQKADRSAWRSAIRFTDYVNDDERAYYYGLAETFVYPSFFEGFGFPPLEAMACGTPVIASNNSSLPEVAGDAALLVDPYSVSDISRAVRALSEDKRLRERSRERGLERAKLFSWDLCARETLNLLKRTAA